MKLINYCFLLLFAVLNSPCAFAQWAEVYTENAVVNDAELKPSYSDSAYIILSTDQGGQVLFFNGQNQVQKSRFSHFPMESIEGAVRYGDSLYICAQESWWDNGIKRKGRLLLYDMVNDSWSLVYDMDSIKSDFGTEGTLLKDVALKGNTLYLASDIYFYNSRQYHYLLYDIPSDSLSLGPERLDGPSYSTINFGNQVAIGGPFYSDGGGIIGPVLLIDSTNYYKTVDSFRLQKGILVDDMISLSRDSALVFDFIDSFPFLLYQDGTKAQTKDMRMMGPEVTSAVLHKGLLFYLSEHSGHVRWYDRSTGISGDIVCPFMTPSSSLFTLNGELYAMEILLPSVQKYTLFRMNVNWDSLSFLQTRLAIDINQNCLIDSNEPGVPYNKIQSADGALTLFSNEEGISRVMVPNGKYIMNTPETIYPNIFRMNCPIDTLVVFGDTVFRDYSIQFVDPGKSMVHQLHALRGWRARKGFEEDYRIEVKNLGDQSENCTYRLEHPLPGFKMKGSSILPDVIQTNSYSWNLNMGAFETQTIWFQGTFDAQFPDSVALFRLIPDSLCTRQGVDSLIVRVVAAYDPNDKQADRPSNMALGTRELEYKIRFQNTGNDTAYNIRILDTLDAFLPISGMGILGSSHVLDSVHVSDVLNDGRVLVEFVFYDILLPDSGVDFSGSQGYVHYRCKIDPAFKLGDSISNTAFIYFDYQPAIITNTTVHRYFMDTTSTAIAPPTLIQQEASEFRVYPNPGREAIVMENRSDGPLDIGIYDSKGQLLKTLIIGGSEKQRVNTQKFPAGVYLLLSADGRVNQKLILY